MSKKSYLVNELTQGWFPCPNVIARSKLPLACKAVWIYLASQPNDWRFSARDIGKAIGISKNTANKALNELQHWNLLNREMVFSHNRIGDVEGSMVVYTLKNPEMNKELIPRKPLK